jgi:diaminopimelate decarboxylase
MTDTERTGPAVRRLDEWDAGRLAALADEHGTPLYVTDLERVRENVRRVARAFPDAHRMYAAKANTGQAVIGAVHDEGMPVECAAAGEVQRAVAAGVDPNEIQYTAVNPPADDLDAMVDLWAENPGMRITAGAADTLDRLAARGFDGDLLIRVNPGIGAGHHEKVATGKDAKFGVPHERVPDLAAEARERFDLVGLHMHVGSGILGDDLENHRRAVERLADVAREVGDLSVVDVGGGFGVPYRPEESPLDLDDVAAVTRDAMGDLDARLAIEPGRYVVADASIILTRVNTRKETPGPTVVGVDAGLTTLIRPAMFDSYHHIRNLTGGTRAPERVQVGGPICSSADVFCQNRPIPRPERGDLLAVGNAGAYGIELANEFHSQPLPAEVAIEGDDARVVRERRTVKDILAREHV